MCPYIFDVPLPRIWSYFGCLDTSTVKTGIAMAPYFGLRGERLNVARIFLVIVPSFLLFGYNQSALGGVLAFESFTSVFPQIDTTNTEGAVKAHNSTVQGESSYTI